MVGLSLWLNNLWLLIALVPAVGLVAAILIPREESFLEDDQYSSYRARGPPLAVKEQSLENEGGIRTHPSYIKRMEKLSKIDPPGLTIRSSITFVRVSEDNCDGIRHVSQLYTTISVARLSFATSVAARGAH